MTTQTDRIGGLRPALAYKAPCVAATTANIALSGAQTIDGVSVTAGDRVLVKSQTTGSENGIYVVGATTWTRAKDFNTNDDVTTGTQVFVSGGSTAGGVYRLTNSGSIVIGTTALTFSSTTSAPTVSTSSYSVVTSISALKALDTGTFSAAQLVADGRSGLFAWKSGDYASSVTLDTEDGIYVKADAVASTSGAWVRQFERTVSPMWFGAAGDGATDDTGPLRAAVIMAGTLKKTLDVGGQSYSVANDGSVTATIIPVNFSEFEMVGDLANDNIKIADSCGNYRAIFGPTSSLEIKEWRIRDVRFHKNSSTNVITPADTTSSGRYAVTCYIYGYVTGSIHISGCLFKDSDAIVDLYFPELGDGSQVNDIIEIESCRWEDSRLGGSSASDYDQSHINISSVIGIIKNCSFVGESWARAPRTAIETHCQQVVIQNNAIEKYQVGVNMCMGLRHTATLDVNQICSGNTLHVSRTGVYIWNYRVSSASSGREAGGNWIVTDNAIYHRWTQYAFDSPRLDAITLFISSTLYLPLSDGVISNNQVIYDLPDGTEAHDRSGQPQSAPAIGWNSGGIATNTYKNIIIEGNSIKNSPGPAIGIEFGVVSNLSVRDNIATDCGISSSTGLPSVYKSAFFFSFSMDTRFSSQMNSACYSSTLYASNFHYIRDRSTGSAPMSMVGCELHGTTGASTAVQYLTMFSSAGQSDRMKIDGGLIPSTATPISTKVVPGSHLRVAGSTLATDLIKVTTSDGAWSKRGYGNAAPTSTSQNWSQYSEFVNTSPSSAGEPVKWICVTGGTPGTWVKGTVLTSM